jgi:putative tryptophan/tyrosine transport system substrate-binding protein
MSRGSSLRRRDAVAVCGGLLLAGPRIGRAQPSAGVARVGCLMVAPAASPVAQSLLGAFRDGLRGLGYDERRNIAFEVRSGEGRIERLRELAAELVRLKVDVIAAFSNAATRAARQATSAVPIVCFNLGDPVGEGFVASLSRPGGNITGFTVLAPELVPKGLSLLKEAVPRASRVAALWSPGSLTESSAADMLEKAAAAANTVGVEIVLTRFHGVDELEGAFVTMTKARSDALLVLPSPLSNTEGSRIASLAARHRLPSISWNRYFVEAGGLMAYGSNLVESWRRGAVYVDRILKGADPAELPIQQPTTFELVINRKTARQLGLNIPASLLTRADQVIE